MSLLRLSSCSILWISARLLPPPFSSAAGDDDDCTCAAAEAADPDAGEDFLAQGASLACCCWCMAACSCCLSRAISACRCSCSSMARCSSWRGEDWCLKEKSKSKYDETYHSTWCNILFFTVLIP